MKCGGFHGCHPWCVGLYGVALLYVALLVPGCGGDQTGGASAGLEDTKSRVSVEVITARSGPFTEQYEVSAVAEPIRSFHLSAEVGGTLAELNADVGDRVSAGQLLARIDDEALTLAAATARARLDRAVVSVSLAQKAYARQQALRQQGSIAESVLEDAELAVRLAEADRKLAELAVQTAERDVRHARIVAPADGEITRRFPEVGAVLAPGAAVFHLSRTDRIRLVAGLSEKEVVHVRDGDAAQVVFDALPANRFTANIVRVGSVDEPGMATFPVEVHLNNADGRIRPGMVGRVTVSGRTIEAAVPVPAVALRRAEDGVGVFVVTDGRSRRVPVSVAAFRDETALVDDGIADGTRVVVVGQAALKGDDAVSVAVVDGAEVGDGRDAPAVYGLP